jgi:Rps23 Pro-64 3,4-dihydroxylase Tpa1-like proline 4-hydroxylase
LQHVRSLSKNLHVSRALPKLSQPLHELLTAFQAPAVTRLLSEIIGVRELWPDQQLDASGLVSLQRGGFENPHLDASHNARGDKYCVLKAIYYLSPDWRLADGGQLELWEEGLDRLPTVTLAKWNRLTLVAMHERSWHSINRVTARRPRRALVHTYYASEPLARREYRHGLSFRGRPDQSLRDLVLRYSQSLPEVMPRTWLL